MLQRSPDAPPMPRHLDVLRWPVVGPALRWRHARTAAQVVLGLIALVIVLHGFLGPQLAPVNLATVLTWVHYRGLLIGALLVAGNVFCGACPMVLVRDLGRHVRQPHRHWPRRLRGKWIALPLFVLVLFAYERFDLWALPAATAWLIVGYFVAAFVVDLTFKGASFCKYVCPVGQFNFIASTLSPLEIQPRERAVCQTCRTKDCIKGRRDETVQPLIVRRGCELGLFVPAKVGNLDCTFCLDCVNACPHDNVALGFRTPGEELADDDRRSAIGRLSRRPDLAALALVFTFGALLNALAMTRPAYQIESWLGSIIGARSETPVLAIMFVAGLVIVPLALCGAAALIARGLTSRAHTIKHLMIRFAYTLVPLGVGVWLAHYGFHFLTALGTIVPVSQSAAIDALGRALLGEPDWRWLGVRPGLLLPLQIGAVLLGGLGSILLVRNVAEREDPGRIVRMSASWIVLVLGLTALAWWILSQPMEMRGLAFGS